ncbi:glycosyltransferase family 2 protein [Phycisphaerales bacterium AB-hyl4]|uniref:Glycosyltransferase family 2 protein n=1 Tax=Natronomicrosphaera hydrolytica TaxID=3242702 RepID=A0ABV4U4L3_9BACT
MISVLMPAYNAERYIDEAIESVLAQTYRDFELIVADDGSTDETLAIARRYAAKDERVHVLTHANMGMGDTLNNALQHAKHEWLARLDADDRMKPERLERQLAFVQTQPELAVLSSLVAFIDEQGGVIGVSRSPFTEAEAVRRAVQTNTLIGFHHPAILMRKSVVQAAGGYRKAFWPADDLDLWNRIAEAGHAMLVQPTVLTEYRIHGESVCVSAARQTTLKLEWVEDCMLRRRAGEPERSWDDFMDYRRQLPWHRRLNHERCILARTLYKGAVQHRSCRQYFQLAPKLLGALALEPGYVAPRVLPWTFSATFGNRK